MTSFQATQDDLDYPAKLQRAAASEAAAGEGTPPSTAEEGSGTQQGGEVDGSGKVGLVFDLPAWFNSALDPLFSIKESV